MSMSRKPTVAVVACAAFAIVALWSMRASADLPNKTFRLHLDSGLFTLQRGEIDWDDIPGDWDLDFLGAGIGMPRACIGLGFVVWRGLVIGGRVETAFYDDEYETGDAETFELAILPYGEYAFLSGIFRPFVTIYLGVRGRSIDYGDNDFDMWGFATGGGGGAHIFLFDRFSIDLTLLMGVEVGGADWDPDGPASDDGDYVMFDMAILVGLSGWI
jgi:hypothetical protein